MESNNNVNRLLEFFNSSSLRLRLTLTLTTLSTLVLGGLISWTAWKMQKIIIDNQKNTVSTLTTRFPKDLEIYSEMLSPQEGLQRTINRLPNPKLLLWVKDTQGNILAESSSFASLSPSIKNKLLSFSQIPLKPNIFHLDKNYYVLCGSFLQAEGKPLGNLFIALDITSDKSMFEQVVRNLILLGLGGITLMSLAIAFYINSSLQPLRQLNQKAASIKSDNLSQAQLSLTQAPSEVKELAQTLNHLLTRLSLSWEREREFTSNVSHELRTPLTLVYGYLQSVLRRGDNLTPIQQESLSIAASEAERTIQILQGLLDLARGESGNLSFQIESLPLQNLVLEVVMMARKSSDRSIILHAPDAPIIAKFDPSRLQQVLVNLLDNALKYSPENTCIIVHLCQDNNHAIMQVTDQGYGIPLQHQARIFERFYRVDESRTQATGGTGLGLAIVKMLVEGMGGEIAVESKLGEGTTFSVSLPLSDVN